MANELSFHPLSEIFPLMSSQELNALTTDIGINGLREPLWLHPDGRILDGRNRYIACQEINFSYTTKKYTGNDPLGFVISLNLQRRHLNESQRAMVATKIASLEKGANQHTQICVPTQKQAANMLNVSSRSVQSAREVIEKATPEVIKKVEQGEITISRALTDVNRKERNQQIVKKCNITPDLPTKKYAVIYADPPWRYEHVKTSNRAIENQYPTMSLEEICALEIDKIANEDAILFLWGTAPKLQEAMQVIKEWGFNYRTCAVWVKDKIGMGYYFRSQHELLLVATKGNIPTPIESARCSSVITANRTAHSEKPIGVYNIIEQMYPDLPKIELFARKKHNNNWAVWGNQV